MEPDDSPDVATLLDRAGWARLVDCLVAGACHDLNGRSTVLHSLAELARTGDESAYVFDALESEAHRLGRLAASLRSMSARGGDGIEVVALHERFGALVELFQVQPGAELVEVDAQIDPQAPAVLAPWSHLSRALLIVLSTAAAMLMRDGGGGSLRVSYGAEAEGLPILRIVGAPTSGGGSVDPSASYLIDHFARWSGDLESAMCALGCVFLQAPERGEANGAGPRIEVRLPTASGGGRPPEA